MNFFKDLYIPMKIKIPKPRKNLFIIFVITLNIIVLIFIFQKFASEVNLARSKIQFKWGEKAPKMLGITAFSGESIEVVPGAKSLTLLVFFNNKVGNEISQINEMWKSLKHNNDLSLIGIFSEDAETAVQIVKSYNLCFPVIIDNRSKIHRLYHFFPQPSRGATLALDKNMKVMISLDAIIRPDLLNDFIIRNTPNAININR